MSMLVAMIALSSFHAGSTVRSLRSRSVMAARAEARRGLRARARRRSIAPVSLGASYVGVDGTAYSGSMTLAPYSSVVLISN